MNRFILALAATSFLAWGTVALAQAPAPSGLANPPAPPPVVPAPSPPPRTLSPVIWTENPDVVQRFNVNGPLVRQMVDAELLKLTSATDLGTAWTRLGITPQDVVGIKITTMGGPLAFHPSRHRPGHLRRPSGRRRSAVSHHHLGQGRVGHARAPVTRPLPPRTPTSASPRFFPAPATIPMSSIRTRFSAR